MENNKRKFGVLANFNCTFGPNDKPLLSHFTDIFYPSLLKYSNKSIRIGRRRANNTRYYIQSVEVHNYNGNLVLTGLIVKSTKLIIRSQIIDGTLRPVNITENSAPYSVFQLFLKNHRMVLVKNQVGSPTLNNFEKVISKILHSFVDMKRESDRKDYPLPTFNIFPIHSDQKLTDVINHASKINKIDFSIKPLNQDINPMPMFNYMGKQGHNIKSNTMHCSYSTPKSKKGVSKMMSRTNGTVGYSLYVTDPDGSKKVIKNDIEKKRINRNNMQTKNVNKRISIPWNTIIESVAGVAKNIYDHIKNDPIMKKVSKGNKSTYSKFAKAIWNKITKLGNS